MTADRSDHRHQAFFNTCTLLGQRRLVQYIDCNKGGCSISIFIDPVLVEMNDPDGPRKAAKIVSGRASSGNPQLALSCYRVNPGTFFGGQAEGDGLKKLSISDIAQHISRPVYEGLARVMIQMCAQRWRGAWANVHASTIALPAVVVPLDGMPMGDA